MQRPRSEIESPCQDPKRQHLGEIKLSAMQQRIMNSVGMGNSMFITGPAGVGKSFIIHHICEVLEIGTFKRIAPTKTAARNIQGQTICSLFKIRRYTDPIDDTGLLHLRRVETLIIDECSMVDSDFFKSMDRALQKIHGIPKPFGGVQIICVGDFLQLPPVTTPSEYLFHSQLWTTLFSPTKQNIFVLNECFRQENRLVFDALCDIRKGLCTSAVKSAMKACSLSTNATRTFEHLLSPINMTVQQANMDQMRRLAGDTKILQIRAGPRDGKYADIYIPEGRTPLKVRPGCYVRLSRDYNIPERLTQGTTGYFVRLVDDYMPLVYFPHLNLTVRIEPLTQWVGSTWVLSFPLEYAYALTVHRAQGETYESCIVDFGCDFSPPGVVYVALSRVKSFDNLYLLQDIASIKINVDEAALSYYRCIEAQS